MSTVYINLESRVSLLTCLGECHSVKAYINIQQKKKTIFIGSLMSNVFHLLRGFQLNQLINFPMIV